MKRLSLILFTLLTFVLCSCSGKKAQETYETAQFEELQRNYVHATKLYQEIVAKYPNSEYAAKASERLKALEGE
jgi:outer membrane protein assembly factor BamD (BamD/ComL family)